MTITESRVKSGTLTFIPVNGDPSTDATVFACQASNVHVTPSYEDDGDRTEVLCGDVILPGSTESWVIGGTSIQDFDNPQGFLTFCFDHAMELVNFTWQPNVTGAPTWAGQCKILALEEGGDVNTRITSDWEFAIPQRPDRTYADGGTNGTSGTGSSTGTGTNGTTTGSTDTSGTGTGSDAPAAAA